VGRNGRLYLFGFFQYVGNERCYIHIQVIENEKYNGSDHDKGHQDEVISPAYFIHTSGSQRFGLLYGYYLRNGYNTFLVWIYAVTPQMARSQHRDLCIVPVAANRVTKIYRLLVF
jgi:hypothetical protein